MFISTFAPDVVAVLLQLRLERVAAGLDAGLVAREDARSSRSSGRASASPRRRRSRCRIASDGRQQAEQVVCPTPSSSSVYTGSPSNHRRLVVDGDARRSSSAGTRCRSRSRTACCPGWPACRPCRRWCVSSGSQTTPLTTTLRPLIGPYASAYDCQRFSRFPVVSFGWRDEALGPQTVEVGDERDDLDLVVGDALRRGAGRTCAGGHGEARADDADDDQPRPRRADKLCGT